MTCGSSDCFNVANDSPCDVDVSPCSGAVYHGFSSDGKMSVTLYMLSVFFLRKYHFSTH